MWSPACEPSRHCCCRRRRRRRPQRLAGLLFPFLSAARLFPPKGHPGRCLRGPEGHGGESKVNTLWGGCKRTRGWKLRSHTAGQCTAGKVPQTHTEVV